MSSPRGLAEGGICAMTVDGPLTLRLEFSAATGGLFGGSGAGLAFAGGDGERRNGRGSSDLNDGRARLRLRCILSGRSALFEWLI
jgi:hypothetical protein